MKEFQTLKGVRLFSQNEKVDFVYFIKKGSVMYEKDFMATKSFSTKFMQFMEGVEQKIPK
jgi:CRP-like cAMP-binding protein